MLRLASNSRVCSSICKGKKAVLLSSTRSSGHALVVPYVHDPVTQFENGIPTTQVRKLKDIEKKFNYWSTSDSLSCPAPSAPTCYAFIPFGDKWVDSKGKVYDSGFHFVMPFTKFLCVKNEFPIRSGLVHRIGDKDVYVVITKQITDYAVSAMYKDPATNTLDSEKSIKSFLQKTVTDEVAKLSKGVAELTAADMSTLSTSIAATMNTKEKEFGIKVLDAEVRGVFPASEEVQHKLTAMNEPHRDKDTPGHNLSCDYWADVLPPPFFEKYAFGSRKESKTPAAVSLEWAIPSPPDYHHFNMIPRMTAADERTPEEKNKYAERKIKWKAMLALHEASLKADKSLKAE